MRLNNILLVAGVLGALYLFKGKSSTTSISSSNNFIDKPPTGTIVGGGEGPTPLPKSPVDTIQTVKTTSWIGTDTSNIYYAPTYAGIPSSGVQFGSYGEAYAWSMRTGGIVNWGTLTAI